MFDIYIKSTFFQNNRSCQLFGWTGLGSNYLTLLRYFDRRSTRTNYNLWLQYMYLWMLSYTRKPSYTIKIKTIWVLLCLSSFTIANQVLLCLSSFTIANQVLLCLSSLTIANQVLLCLSSFTTANHNAFWYNKHTVDFMITGWSW